MAWTHNLLKIRRRAATLLRELAGDTTQHPARDGRRVWDRRAACCVQEWSLGRRARCALAPADGIASRTDTTLIIFRNLREKGERRAERESAPVTSSAGRASLFLARPAELPPPWGLRASEEGEAWGSLQRPPLLLLQRCLGRVPADQHRHLQGQRWNMTSPRGASKIEWLITDRFDARETLMFPRLRSAPTRLRAT